MANLTNHINFNTSWGGGGDVTAGDAIRIDSGNEVNVKFDNTTIVLNDNGELTSTCCEDSYPRVCITDESPTIEWQIVQDNCYDGWYYKAIMTGWIEPGTRYLTIESTGTWSNTWISKDERFYATGTSKTFEVITSTEIYSDKGIMYTFPTSLYSLDDQELIYNIMRNTWMIVTDIKNFVDPNYYLYTSKWAFSNSPLLTKWELQAINVYPSSGSWTGQSLTNIGPTCLSYSTAGSLYRLDGYYDAVETYWGWTDFRNNRWYFYVANDTLAFRSDRLWEVSYCPEDIWKYIYCQYVNGWMTSGSMGRRYLRTAEITLPIYQDLYWRKVCYIDVQYGAASSSSPQLRTWYLLDSNDRRLWVFYQKIHSESWPASLYANEVRMTFGTENQGIPWRLIWSKISWASLIDYSGPILQATDVNGAINELAQSVNDIEQSMPDPYTAWNGIDITNNVISANISTMQYDNSVSWLTATNVKDAIDELSTKSNMPEIRAGNWIVIHYPWEVGWNEAMIWPCDQWYHVPTEEEFQSVLDAVWTTYSTVKNILHLPYSWFMSNQSSYWTWAWYLWTCSPSWTTQAKAMTYQTTLWVYASDRCYLYPVRAIKDKPVTPDSSWTETMSGKVWENSSLWLISVLVWTNKYITLQDKNVWATEVFNGTDNDNNRGQLFQRWNSYWFTWRNIPTATNSKINAWWYAPSTYNSNMCVNTSSWDWSSVQNDDLWWWVTWPTVYDAITIEAI